MADKETLLALVNDKKKLDNAHLQVHVNGSVPLFSRHCGTMARILCQVFIRKMHGLFV
jgi:hypothetical protein